MMQKFILGLILLCAASLIITAQDEPDGLKVPSEVTPFVEKDTKPIALETADLNGDGTADFVLVLENLKAGSGDEPDGQRILLILTRGTDNKLILARRNDKGLVYCRQCGGVFGDPFEGVEVAPKTFTVNMYGGSSWRWSYSYKFNYSRIDKTWQLVRVEEGSFNSLDLEQHKETTYTPPKDFGKIDIADFDPEHYLKKKPGK